MTITATISKDGQVIPIPLIELRGFMANVLRSIGWQQIETPRDFKIITAIQDSRKLGNAVWKFEFKLRIDYKAFDDKNSVLGYTITETEVGLAQKCQEKLDELVLAVDSLARNALETASEQETPNTFGVACFADEAELEAKGYLTDDTPSNRLLIAPYGNRYLTVPVQYTNMHALVCGPTGAGKSTGFFIPNIVSRTGGSAIITEATAGDETPELFGKTAGWRAFKRSKVYFFNPSYPKGTRINPLDRLKLAKSSDFAQVADDIANLVIVNTTPANSLRGDPIWDKSERHLLWIMIMHVASSNDPELAHFGAIREILRKPEKQIKAMLQDSPSVIAREEFDSFLYHSSENFRHGVFAGLLQRLNPWLSDVIQTMTRTTDLDLSQLKNERFSFYLSVPSRKTHLKPITALIFNFILDLALAENFEFPPALILDEFTNFGAIPGIEDALSLIRKRDLPVVLGIQTYDQIEKVYGRVVAQSLTTQLATRVFFRPRHPIQAEQISRELGDKTVLDKKTDDRGHTNLRELGRNLMTAREIQTLSPGEVIVMTESTNPIRTRRFDHTTFPAPTGFDPPPLVEHSLLKVDWLDNDRLSSRAASAKRKAEEAMDFHSTKASLEEAFRDGRARRCSTEDTALQQDIQTQPIVEPKEQPTVESVPQKNPETQKKAAKCWDIPG